MIALCLAAGSSAAFTCVPVRAHDGDTFTCAGGRRVRTADGDALEALETAEIHRLTQ